MEPELTFAPAVFTPGAMALLAQADQYVSYWRGYHRHCAAVLACGGMPVPDATDAEYLNPICACYKVNSEIHWEGERAVKELEACPACAEERHAECEDVRALRSALHSGPEAQERHLRKSCLCYLRQDAEHWGHVQFSPATPTKQRPGDQPLPQGGQRCVQDFIIEQMEQSKMLGTERYGTPLMTFNGRITLQDAAEEARDLLVYLTQLRMEAEVSQRELAEVITAALVELERENGLFCLLTAEDSDQQAEQHRKLGYVAYWLAERLQSFALRERT